MRSVSVVLPLSMCAEMPMFLARGSIAANAAAVDANDRDDDGGGAIEETIADAGGTDEASETPKARAGDQGAATARRAAPIAAAYSREAARRPEAPDILRV
jgi:hypothetical protein